MNQVRVEGAPAEAVRAGQIEGTVYSDSEVWAEYESLRAWVLAQHAAGPVDRACVCGHWMEEHGDGAPVYTGCTVDNCSCIAYEAEG